MLGEELIEFIPARIRTPIVEPSENTFSLKTYQGSEGEKYMVSCSNKLFKTSSSNSLIEFPNKSIESTGYGLACSILDINYDKHMIF